MKRFQHTLQRHIGTTTVLIFAGCLFSCISVPRLSLDAPWSSDEARGLHRSAQFMSAVKQGEFSETLIAHHPGVTTMWLAGLRTFFIPPRVDVPNLARARWFIGVVVWIGLGIACFLIYRLLGRWVGFAISRASASPRSFWHRRAVCTRTRLPRCSSHSRCCSCCAIVQGDGTVVISSPPAFDIFSSTC